MCNDIRPWLFGRLEKYISDRLNNEMTCKGYVCLLIHTA